MATIESSGAQAFAPINKKVVTPSVPLKMGGASKMFKTAIPLTEEEIWDIVKRFGNSARILKEAGFTGCQIHGAHGYLVSQFYHLVAIEEQINGEEPWRTVLALY